MTKLTSGHPEYPSRAFEHPWSYVILKYGWRLLLFFCLPLFSTYMAGFYSGTAWSFIVSSFLLMYWPLFGYEVLYKQVLVIRAVERELLGTPL